LFDELEGDYAGLKLSNSSPLAPLWEKIVVGAIIVF
jgi:hypothetical protein